VIAYMASRIALLISQRNKQIESQLSDLHTLYDVASALGSITDEDEMLCYLAATLKTLQDASMCVVGLVNDDARIQVKASAGASPEALQKIGDLRVDKPVFADLLHHSQPLVIEDIDKHAEFKALGINPTSKALYIFPFRADAKVLGAISLSFDRAKPLSHEYHHLLSAIASQVGVALQRAQLFADAQRMALEMSALYDVGLHTGSTLSTREAISRTA